MSEKSVNIVVWCGLTHHHTESARDLPEATRWLVEIIKAGARQIASDGLLLEPIIEDGALAGFGVVIDRMWTLMTPHHVRTKSDLPRVYK